MAEVGFGAEEILLGGMGTPAFKSSAGGRTRMGGCRLAERDLGDRMRIEAEFDPYGLVFTGGTVRGNGGRGQDR